VTVAAPAAAREGTRGGLEIAASFSFLLFVATLSWSIAAMSIGLALCGALTAVVWWKERARLRGFVPFVWPIVAWIVALALVAWFAEDRAGSVSRIGKGFLPLLAWVAAWHGRRPANGRLALAVWLGSAALAAALGIALWAVQGIVASDRARGPSGHYMTFGGQLLLWLPVATAVALLARRPRWRLGALLAALVGFAALAATFTRSAWIGAAVALVVVFAVARPRWLPAVGLVVALLVALAPAAYRERLASSFDPTHPSNVERRLMWEAGGRMFRDHPITGVGLMDLHATYDRYRSTEARERIGHLHSVLVQIAATMGVIGLAAFTFLYLALLRAATAGVKAQVARGGVAAGLRLGASAALVGFLMAGFFEWNFGDEELLDALYTLVGLAFAARAWPDESAPTAATVPEARG
jgi:O-antigen ligase